MSPGSGQTLGLIAGWGRSPCDLARSARRHGRRVVAIGFRGLTHDSLEAEVESLVWLHLGELDALIRVLHEAGAKDAVMAGKVPKTALFAEGSRRRADARALELIQGLRDRRDDAILSALVATLEAEGIRVREQAELVPELLAPEGPLGALAPTAEQLADVAFGWPIAKALGELDVGQTVVVRERAVLAVEAIEGTDAAIRRGGALGGPGACVIKVAKPSQDPRFDLPAVGLETLEALADAKASLLAVEAGHTLVIERDALVRAADARGIALLGAAGPPRGGRTA